MTEKENIQGEDLLEVWQIIEKAKERYPATFSFRGKLSSEERKEIENNGCDIRNPSVYMDGSCYYVITYRKRSHRISEKIRRKEK